MQFYYLDPFLCMYFLAMYYESDVMQYCPWGSFSEL